MAYKKPSFPKNYLPSKDEVKKYHFVWDSLDNYRDHEKALSLLFRNPDSPFVKNDEITKVIIKVSALNDFYSTNIYRVHNVALKIDTIKDFDKRLQNGDISLVDELRYVTFKAYKIPDDSDKGIWKEEKKDIYSFATKYCSHHQPDKFPIYDKYVDDVITKLKKQYPEFFKFKIFDSFNTSIPIEERKCGTLKDYRIFVNQIDSLRKNFNLLNFGYKDIDRYLWQLGKRYFAPYPDSVNGEIDYSKFGL